MTEKAYASYFEKLARMHHILRHKPEEKNGSFFCINNPYELTEFDNALRDNSSTRVLLLDAPTGYLTDNGSANYTQMTKIDFLVVGEVNHEPMREVRNDCFYIGMDIVSRIRTDAKKNTIIPGRYIYLLEDNITYDVVGPLYNSHYGYAFSLQLCCPFNFSMNVESWTDMDINS